MADAEPHGVGAKATRREWIGLGVLALPCLIYSMDLNVLFLAMPQIQQALRPTASQALWIVDIYGFLLAGLMVGYVLFCAGLGPLGALTTDLVMGSAPPERAGAASGISETSFEVGGALGIAVLGSVVLALYRMYFADAAPPGLPAETLAAARSTLGGATDAARELGAGGDALLDAARAAYVRTMAAAAGLCAALSVSAALGVVLLRRYFRVAGPSS